jgi:hypothetical protein
MPELVNGIDRAGFSKVTILFMVSHLFRQMKRITNPPPAFL